MLLRLQSRCIPLLQLTLFHQILTSYALEDLPRITRQSHLLLPHVTLCSHNERLLTVLTVISALIPHDRELVLQEIGALVGGGGGG